MMLPLLAALHTHKPKVQVYHPIRARVTAYSSPPGALTATGSPVGIGVCAVDPRVIPLGSLIWIYGYGMCRALDTGSDVIGRRIDVWLPSVAQAVSWGVKHMVVVWEDE